LTTPAINILGLLGSLLDLESGFLDVVGHSSLRNTSSRLLIASRQMHLGRQIKLLYRLVLYVQIK